jgi:transposase
VISAVTVAPRRRRLGLYWDMQAANYTTAPGKALAEAVQRRLGRPILLIWDRLGARRSAARRWREEGTDRIAVAFLPGYAPDLNPAEQVWGHTKWADLANLLPAGLEDRGEAIDGSLGALACEPHLLRSFFRASGLTLE